MHERSLRSDPDRAAHLDDYLPHPLFEGVWPASGRLKAMRHIPPLYQGEHVGLSGLYALVNAFRLALHRHRPLSDEEARRLLTVGIRFIDTHGQLRHALTGGIRLNLWWRLGEALREHLIRAMGIHLQIEQPFRHGPALDTAQLLSVLETMVQRQQPVIILRRGAHYTVIAGYTPISLILFDSSGRWWVRRSACVAAGGMLPARHMFYPGSLAIVSTLM